MCLLCICVSVSVCVCVCVCVSVCLCVCVWQGSLTDTNTWLLLSSLFICRHASVEQVHACAGKRREANLLVHHANHALSCPRVVPAARLHRGVPDKRGVASTLCNKGGTCRGHFSVHHFGQRIPRLLRCLLNLLISWQLKCPSKRNKQTKKKKRPPTHA